jgi:sialic acid synthase SpsE
MTLAQASTGFRNQGQFLAAVNVSRNLGIDFVKLQTAMTGQKVSIDPTTHEIITKPTGDAPVSLGRAIQTLKPGVDADAAVQTAQTQSSAMVQSTSTTTTSSTTTSSTTTSSSTTSSTTSSPTTTATTSGKTKKKTR